MKNSLILFISIFFSNTLFAQKNVINLNFEKFYSYQSTMNASDSSSLSNGTTHQTFLPKLEYIHFLKPNWGLGASFGYQQYKNSSYQFFNYTPNNETNTFKSDIKYNTYYFSVSLVDKEKFGGLIIINSLSLPFTLMKNFTSNQNSIYTNPNSTIVYDSIYTKFIYPNQFTTGLTYKLGLMKKIYGGFHIMASFNCGLYYTQQYGKTSTFNYRSSSNITNNTAYTVNNSYTIGTTLFPTFTLNYTF